MAPLSSSLAFDSLPLPQLIIALLLIKTKPSAIPVKAYIAELRKLIRGEPSSKEPSISDTYLDAIAYWRNAFSISQADNRLLRSRIAALETENKAHPNSSTFNHHHRGRTSEAGPSRGKRKKFTTSPRPRSTRLAKQARIANTSSPMQSRQKDARPDDTVTEMTTPVLETQPAPDQPLDQLLHQVNTLQRFKLQPTPEPIQLAAHLHKALEVLASLVSPISTEDHTPAIGHHCRILSKTKTEAEDSTPYSLRAIGSLIPVLLQGIGLFAQTNENLDLAGPIIYKFVDIYKTVLHQVCTLAVHKRSTPAVAATEAEMISRLRGKQPARIEIEVEGMTTPGTHFENVLSLCDLAVAMTTAIQPGSPAQARMLEGCLSHLMTKIGSGLRTSIFGLPLHENGNNDQTSNNEATLSNPEHDDLRIEADRLFSAQAPYLIYILARTPTKLPTSMDKTTTTISSSSSTPRTLHHNLTHRKLQNTLLTAVFPSTTLDLMRQQTQILAQPVEPSPAALQQLLLAGQHSADAEHEAAAAAATGGMDRKGKGKGKGMEKEKAEEKEVDVREWFKSEVFRLVGWDVLDEWLRGGCGDCMR